jgi:AcrR family transcriptional regulator
MRILTEKPDTKRPAIARAATSLFARKGIDATSMRDIAEGAGVREAAIYRHFEGKEQLAREIFLSWYGWFCAELERIIGGSDRTVNKLRQIVVHEFSAAANHAEAFVYFCRNEARFARELPREIKSARRIFAAFIAAGQKRGELRSASPELLADMLSGALCTVALVWLATARRKRLDAQLEEVTQARWGMIEA